jgi:hypothetical protein
MCCMMYNFNYHVIKIMKVHVLCKLHVNFWIDDLLFSNWRVFYFVFCWCWLQPKDFDYEFSHLGNHIKNEVLNVLKPFIGFTSSFQLRNEHNMLVHMVEYATYYIFNSMLSFFGSIKCVHLVQFLWSHYDFPLLLFICLFCAMFFFLQSRNSLNLYLS